MRRGSLRITVVERGNLESANSVSLKSEVEGRPTILWLIEEGTMVQPGDLLCELDTSQIEDELFEQELAVERARAAFGVARISDVCVVVVLALVELNVVEQRECQAAAVARIVFVFAAIALARRAGTSRALVLELGLLLPL